MKTQTRVPAGASLKERMLIQLSQRSAWSLGLAFAALLVYTGATIAFDLFRTGNFDPLWILIWAVTYIEITLLAVLALAVLPRKLWRSTGIGVTTNVLLASMLGAIKNSSVYVLATWLGLEDTPWDPFLRIGGGAMLLAFVFTLYVLLYSSRTSHKMLMRNLQQRYSELDQYRGLIPETTSKAKQDLIDETKQALLPKLKMIENLLENRSSVRPVISNLQELIEKSVRPLSKAFQEQAEQISTEKASVRRWNAGYSFPQRFRLRENLSVTATLILSLPSIVFVFYMIDALGYWQILAAGIAWTWVNLIFSKYGSPKNANFSRRSGLIRITAIALIAPIPTSALFLFAIPDSLVGKGLLVGATAFIIAASVVSVIYINVLDDMRGALELENQSINEKIAFELAVFNQTLWLQKRRWGYLLHGKVQSNLTAALARLRSLEASALDNPTQEGMLIELVRQDLNRAADALNSDALGSVDLAQELANIQDSWRGVVDVSIQISDHARRALERSDNIRMSLVEICREAVTNAHRHGSATTMTIQIDRQDDTTMQLTCTNNGSEPKTKSGGMGTQMMDALTIDWSLEHKKAAGLTVLSARLPIAV
jgi:signal transduction histidine kinase